MKTLAVSEDPSHRLFLSRGFWCLGEVEIQARFSTSTGGAWGRQSRRGQCTLCRLLIKIELNKDGKDRMRARTDGDKPGR
jgi:hypothetical protein